MTDRYAVIGNPVEHSLSPAIHAEFARETGQDLAYGRLLAAVDGFRAAALEFRDGGGRGLNVTLPFKHEAWKLADARAGHAQAAGAVNTLKFEQGRIVGHNTDGAGLRRDLIDNLGCAVRGRRVLLAGAGGASYGVMEPLLREQPQALVVANRTAGKAVALAGEHFDIVINATSAGLADAMPPLPRGVFAPGALAYDMVYGRRTPFMSFAAACGARVSDGLGMVVEQAAESFFFWRGVRPSTAPVIQALRRKAEGESRKGER